MWIYEKKLQYPVKIKNPNPKLAQIIISQLGGPDGELAASMRYLHQRYAMPYKQVVGILTDVGTEASETSRPTKKSERPLRPARETLLFVYAYRIMLRDPLWRVPAYSGSHSRSPWPLPGIPAGPFRRTAFPGPPRPPA